MIFVESVDDDGEISSVLNVHGSEIQLGDLQDVLRSFITNVNDGCFRPPYGPRLPAWRCLQHSLENIPSAAHVEQGG